MIDLPPTWRARNQLNGRSAGVEYDHLFMQDKTTTFTPVVGPVFSDRIRQDVDLVTVRVNYRWGGPVVGRY